MSFVVDTSAVIAALMDEPGGDLVFERAQDCIISTVNLAEVFGFAAQRNHPPQLVDAFLDETGMTVMPFSRELAATAGKYAAITRSAGLSLGDRCCLALAASLGIPTLTGDRPWLQFAEPLGVTIEMIR
jgi:ribonuclease VapC